MADLTKEDLKEAFAAALKESGGGYSNKASSSAGGDGGLGNFGKNVSEVTNKFNPLTAAIDSTSAVYRTTASVYRDIESVIKPNLETWRNLSSTGSAFGGDIVSMSAAAKGARLDLNEFSSLVEKNAGKFNGLTTSVGKGADSFALLSKEMFDSNVTGSLKELGYTNKDLNDVLALTVSNYATMDANDQQSRAQAIASATALATEMDAMAKLTGVSRKAQMEQMKEAQADMQVEAKLRLLTMGKSEEEQKKIRDEYLKNYEAAKLRGDEQVFKEVFATGTVQSEKAATQMAVLGEQSRATYAQAQAARNGDYAQAAEMNAKAQAGMMENQNNVQKLTIASMSSTNVASKAMQQSMTDNTNVYKTEQALYLKMEKEGRFAGVKDEAEKRRLVHEEALKQAKAPVTAPGAESTKALVNLESRSNDVGAAFSNHVIKPINEHVGPSLKRFNDGLLGGKVITKTGEKMTTSDAASAALKAGVQSGLSPTPVTGGINEAAMRQPTGPSFFGSDALKGLGEVGGVAARGLTSGLNALPTGGAPAATGAAPATTTTLDDIKSQLEKLNTTMTNMLNHTENISDASDKQVRATKSLSNNRFAN
jgi:hypothetical protein